MDFLNIPQVYTDRIHTIYGLIKVELPASEIYLFGSYVKRKIKSTSDMDLLVLVDNSMDKKQLKAIKWKIEEIIEEAINFEYEVDLKMYTKAHFNQCKQSMGFEAEIAKYMIELEESLWT